MSAVAKLRPGNLGARGAVAGLSALVALVLLVTPTGARASLTPTVPPNPGIAALKLAQRTVSQALAQAAAPAAMAPVLARAAAAARSSGGASIAVAPTAPAPAPQAEMSDRPPPRAPSPAPVTRLVPPTKPGPSPIDPPRAAPGGHAPSIAASAPPDVSVSLDARQLESQLASTSWVLAGPSDELAAGTSLGPEPPTLVAVLDSLARGEQSLSAVAGPSKPPAPSLPAVGLLAPAHRQAAPGPQRSTNEMLVVPVAQRPLASVPTTLAGTQSVGLIQVGQRPGGARRARQRFSAATGSSSAVAQAEPTLTSLPAGGVAGTASGGVGVGAAAPALLAFAAVSLLPLLLPGRLALELVPWQSALLAWRLERPG
jgi:hypothetical protein